MVSETADPDEGLRLYTSYGCQNDPLHPLHGRRQTGLTGGPGHESEVTPVKGSSVWLIDEVVAMNPGGCFGNARTSLLGSAMMKVGLRTPTAPWQSGSRGRRPVALREGDRWPEKKDVRRTKPLAPNEASRAERGQPRQTKPTAPNEATRAERSQPWGGPDSLPVRVAQRQEAPVTGPAPCCNGCPTPSCGCAARTGKLSGPPLPGSVRRTKPPRRTKPFAPNEATW
jgi:hypothetical protein